MPHVVLTEDPRNASTWRAFDRRLAHLLSQLATTALGAARIRAIFEDGVSDPTDIVDGILWAERRHLLTYPAAPREPLRTEHAGVAAPTQRLLR